MTQVILLLTHYNFLCITKHFKTHVYEKATHSWFYCFRHLCL